MIKGKQKTGPPNYSEVSMTGEMKSLAKIRADKIPKNIKNSIRKGEGRFCGAIGEVAFIHISKGTESIGREVYNFDVILPDGSLCEVKTKERKDCPLGHYTCSVTDFNPNQECDYYVFGSTLDDYSKTWIVGYLTNEEFKQKALKRRKGDFDPDNGQICSADCWDVTINQLRDIKEII